MGETEGRAARPRVLAMAEAANPEQVSVPLVGWSHATALRAVADVHIVTQIRNRDAFLRAGLSEGADFTAIDSEAVAAPLHRLASRLRGGAGKGWTTVSAIGALAYPYFEHLVWRRFGPDIRAGRFDIVHRITPLTPTRPSPIARRTARAGVPFVLGPLNGGLPWPPGFGDARHAEREWLSYIRSAYKLLPGRTATLAHAAAIIAGSRHTAAEIPDRFADKLVYIPENGILPERFSLPTRPAPGSPPRVVFIGRLVPYKGCDMLIEAAAPLVAAGRLALDIVGDGPMMAELRALAGSQALGDGVTFHGWQPHEEVQRIAVGADLLGFPSVREFGGGVVLEAMALGVAPLIVDYGGPAELVTPETGVKIPLGDRASITATLRTELARLTADPVALHAMGIRARARVHEKYVWAAKARQTAEVYAWVLGRRDRPDLFPEHGPPRT
ncbi:MAG: glycosyltransferase family 4 protein [Pseudomonadota bacterium]